MTLVWSRALGQDPDVLRRRHAPPQVAVQSLDDVRAVILDEVAGDRARVRAQAYETLAAIVDEAVILQDVTEDLLVDIRNREPLADLAPRGGRLASRFVELRGQLPELGDPEVDRYTNLLRMVFDHHALMVSSSLDLLTVDWRSERMVDQLERIDGLGRPAEWLDATRLELLERRRTP